MRLLRFYIHEHRVLKGLDISFDPEGNIISESQRNYHLDFLVGVNGTGKSTVLQLLGRIFRQSFDELRDIPFILEYYREKDNQKTRIANIDPHQSTSLEQFSVTNVKGLDGNLDGESAQKEKVDALDPALFPERVIAYTSGSQAAWFAQDGGDPFENSNADALQNLTPAERVIQELPGWTLDEEREAYRVKEQPYFRFVWQDQLALVGLGGLLLHSMHAQSPLQPVLKESGISRLAGFSLQFDLAHSSANEHNNIWQTLGQHASRAIRNGGNLLLIFQPDKFEAVFKENATGLALFERLADWQRRPIPLLVKVNLFLERHQKDAQGNPIQPPLHTWDWLSDGERSFIGRMCLFMLFGDVESLILLDEPEVHFNDFWKRHIVSMMSKVFAQKAEKSHVLIATHSSISLSDVPSEDVIILERPDLLTDRTRQPDIRTFGADPSDIMVHVFGAPHATGAYSVQEIERKLDEARKKPDNERRAFLSAQLQCVSPGYWAYRIRREMVGLPTQ